MTGRGQGTGIAVGENTHIRLQQFLPVLSHPSIDLNIFFVHQNGLIAELALEIFQSTVLVLCIDFPHPSDRPEEVLGRGAGVMDHPADAFELLFQIFLAQQVFDSKGDPHGGRHSNGRGPPDHHVDYGFSNFFDRPVGVVNLFSRKQPLIDHHYACLCPFNRLNHVVTLQQSRVNF